MKITIEKLNHVHLRVYSDPSIEQELSDFFNISIPVGDLPEAAKAWEIAVTQLADEDSEISEYVRQLEADKDDSDIEEVTGDDIAKEFERFLRRQGDAE